MTVQAARRGNVSRSNRRSIQNAASWSPDRLTGNAAPRANTAVHPAILRSLIGGLTAVLPRLVRRTGRRRECGQERQSQEQATPEDLIHPERVSEGGQSGNQLKPKAMSAFGPTVSRRKRASGFKLGERSVLPAEWRRRRSRAPRIQASLRPATRSSSFREVPRTRAIALTTGGSSGARHSFL